MEIPIRTILAFNTEAEQGLQLNWFPKGLCYSYQQQSQVSLIFPLGCQRRACGVLQCYTCRIKQEVFQLLQLKCIAILLDE